MFNPAKTGMKLSKDSLIGNRFRLHRELGRGDFATVWLCTDTRETTTAVIKCSPLEEADAVEEAKILNELSGTKCSAYVPRFLASGISKTDSLFYCGMSLIEGMTLRDYKKSTPKLAPETVGKIAYHLIVSVRLLHAAGVVHNDIHASNVIIHINKPVPISLIDFGKATKLSAKQYTDKKCFVMPPTPNTDFRMSGRLIMNLCLPVDPKRKAINTPEETAKVCKENEIGEPISRLLHMTVSAKPKDHIDVKGITKLLEVFETVQKRRVDLDTDKPQSHYLGTKPAVASHYVGQENGTGSDEKKNGDDDIDLED